MMKEVQVLTRKKEKKHATRPLLEKQKRKKKSRPPTRLPPTKIVQVWLRKS